MIARGLSEVVLVNQCINWSLPFKQLLESAVLGIRHQDVQYPMDMNHLCLELLESLLQALQLPCGFVMCSYGLINYADGADNELQSDTDEAHYASSHGFHCWIGWPLWALGAIGVEWS